MSSTRKREGEAMTRLIPIAKKTFHDFSDDDCMSSAAAMAYYAIFSLPPLLALVVTIAGYFGVEPERIQTMVQDQWGVASSENGKNAGERPAGNDAEKADESSDRAAGLWGVASRVIAGILLVFSATGLFAQLQYTLNRAWEVKPDPNRGGVLAFIGKRVLSLGMILVVVFLLLVSMLLTTVIDEIISQLKGGPADSTTIVLGITLNNVVAFLVATLLFAAMFKVLPDAEIGWRDVWFGAVVTGLLFVVGKSLIALYLQNSDTASAWGDAAAALIGVLVWMYYSSIIVLFGAELTQAWAAEHGRAIEPSEGAVPADAAK
jgi:membrane protein